jgi:spermidine synthase
VWDYFSVGPVLADSPKEMLILGLGGGTIVNQFLGLFNAHIDVVENSRKVVELATEHFNVRESGRLKIIEGDALEYLRDAKKIYDVIVVDVFEGDAIPEKFTEQSFMELASNHLSENGVIVVNTIATDVLLLTSDLMLENARSFFPSVHILDEEGNRLIIALKFKADYSKILERIDSCNNPLFEELKPKIKTRIRQYDA